MPTRTFLLPDSAATEKLAAGLAPYLRAGDCLALAGDLGAGKTCLARGLLRALGVTGDVPSPTFTLAQYYDTPALSIVHFDLYRLKQAEDVLELGWEEALQQSLTVIEWPDRAGDYLPEERVTITLAVTGTARQGTMDLSPTWVERLKDWIP